MALARERAVPLEIWQSVDGFFETPHDAPPKYVLMISVYLDESRHDDPNSFMVLAGFWGNKEQWGALAPDWIAGLGKRKSLHMNTLRMGSKTGARRAEELLARLGPLPRKHGLRPVYAAVRTGDYQDIIQTSQQRRRFPGYSICLTAVMQRLSLKIPSHERVKIACEIQKAYEESAIRAFRQTRCSKPISNPDRPYWNSIEFIPKGSSVFTQPSDFLAYAIAEHYRDENSIKAKLCEPILGPIEKMAGLTLSREVIRKIVTGAVQVFEHWQ